MRKIFQPLLAIFIIIISFAGCIISDTSFLDGNNDPHTQPPDISKPQNDPQNTNSPEAGPADSYSPPGEFRAVWVASVLNLDFPTKPGLSEAAIKREIEAIVATTADLGLNAVILQVRPAGDAFYESEIFPWSRWLTGEQGRGIPGFDPLAFWLEACHAGNIELHAWLNPYRIIHTSDNSSDPETLAASNPVRQNPSLAVGWTGSDNRSGLFLDPGLPEARRLIFDGISELITKYDVDGIHIDDYFYPGTDFNDASTYELYGGGLDLGDWRRENVNELIRGIGTIIREHNIENDKNVRWGVSPTAIWKNESNDPFGVPSARGQESYNALYADTRRWVMEEWIDYICPQIYWYIGYEIADFKAVFDWWNELCGQFNVDFYVGHAAYREYEDNQPPHWQGEIIRQLDMVAASETAKGSILYRYFSLRSSVGASVRGYYNKKDGSPGRDPLIILDKLSIGFPEGDDEITGTPASVSGYNIIGTSLPDKPLHLNGSEVTTRTAEGFFHVFVPLEQGDNLFTFSQDGEQPVTCTITLKEPAGGGDNYTDIPAITNITTPEYATVTADNAWVYTSNSSSNALGYMLTRGQRDRVTARSDNNYVKLSCGAWVNANSVTIQRENTQVKNALSSGTYRAGADYDMLAWPCSVFPAAVVLYDGETLSIHFGMQETVPPLELPDNPGEQTLFQNARSGINDGIPFYEFGIKENAGFEGYHTVYEDGEFRLYLKKRKTLSGGNMPLSGITIMLDAGHGGSSLGSVGPFGNALPEKDINLINTFKLAERLELLGADVILSRSDDTDISLQERVDISRRNIPDLFISLHANSVAETTNSNNIRGFTVWYHNASGAAFSKTALDVMHFINPGTNRRCTVNQSNFYVCRPWWSPHVIFEASFMMSLDDFVWLIDPVQQDRLADAAVDAILDYFTDRAYP